MQPLFQYRSLAPLYYRDASAAIVVYDITNQVCVPKNMVGRSTMELVGLIKLSSSQGSFYALQDWIKEIKRYGPPECVVAIAGNKCDLEDQREVNQKRKCLLWKYIRSKQAEKCQYLFLFFKD